MPFLTAIVILVGALCLLNLVLVLGVTRRLREHAELLNSMANRDAPPPFGVQDGQIADFEAATTEGDPVSRATLPGRTLVAFLSSDCSACAEQLPRFVEYAAGLPGGREQVLAVVVGAQESPALVSEVAPVARVVEESHGGPVSQAFAVQGFPAFCWLDEGVIGASGFDVQTLTASHPA